ncbi:hypothetical protein [Flavobacterium facile]|uniref:hypothetical protein n=1 Tax=Flavobacterium facile TaxID=2893174 RepID=UPI002E75F0CF|nr:hypothetical protein [Flavobacterium sp. T-12]
MIRSYFKREPEKLSLKKWTKLYNEAQFLKKLDTEILATVLAKLFQAKPENE